MFYLAPQYYAGAERLYDWSASHLFEYPDPHLLSEQLADPRNFAVGLMIAREMGDSARYQALHALAEQFGEPTWDRTRGEFYYGFGLDEPYPRGQANAVMMADEAGGKQAWWRIFNEPNLRKFDQPTVYGVDFPRLGISQAISRSRRRYKTMRISSSAGEEAGARSGS